MITSIISLLLTQWQLDYSLSFKLRSRGICIVRTNPVFVSYWNAETGVMTTVGWLPAPTITHLVRVA